MIVYIWIECAYPLSLFCFYLRANALYSSAPPFSNNDRSYHRSNNGWNLLFVLRHFTQANKNICTTFIDCEMEQCKFGVIHIYIYINKQWELWLILRRIHWSTRLRSGLRPSVAIPGGQRFASIIIILFAMIMLMLLCALQNALCMGREDAAMVGQKCAADHTQCARSKPGAKSGHTKMVVWNDDHRNCEHWAKRDREKKVKNKTFDYSLFSSFLFLSRGELEWDRTYTERALALNFAALFVIFIYIYIVVASDVPGSSVAWRLNKVLETCVCVLHFAVSAIFKKPRGSIISRAQICATHMPSSSNRTDQFQFSSTNTTSWLLTRCRLR